MNEFLRFKELAAVGVPWSRTYVDRLENQGRFPARVHLGPGTVAWYRKDILEFVAKAVAGKRGIWRGSQTKAA